MSFTSNVKNEASKLEILRPEKTAELSAIISSAGKISDYIKITTENPSVARCVFHLFKDLYEISPKLTVRRGYNFNKNYYYILEVNLKVQTILSDLGLEKNQGHFIPKPYVIDDDEQKRAYLRGVFLTIGSINDPKTSQYHLELIADNEKYAIFISDLLNYFLLNSKIIKRQSKYMVYIKEAEKIGDFLRIIEASQSVLYFEDIRIYRDHKNMTNRLNNCEQANVDKAISSANEQIRDIEIIESIGGLDLLDEKIKLVCIYRKKYPDASLLELSEIISIETGKPITKSGLNHRMNKIKSLATKIKDKGEN